MFMLNEGDIVYYELMMLYVWYNMVDEEVVIVWVGMLRLFQWRWQMLYVVMLENYLVDGWQYVVCCVNSFVVVGLDLLFIELEVVESVFIICSKYNELNMERW